VLCKHEVVGSIPSGSTSLRWLRQLRLGEPDRSEGCRVVARKSEGGLSARPNNIVRETSLRTRLSGWTAACVISDIVKRRSIRVWVQRSNSRDSITISGIISALAHRKMSEL
jgi:hypothetical protein